MKNLKNQIAPVSVALAALLIAGNAWAASGNKKATGTMNIGTVDWDAAMGTGDTGTFDNSKFAITPTQLSTMDLGSANISILALVFKNNLQGPWTIGSSGNYFLQLNQNSTYYRGGATPNTSIDLSSVNQNGIFNCPLVIGGNVGANNQQFNVANTYSLTFNKNITNGANTFTLAGAGSYFFGGNIVSTAPTAGLTMNGTGIATFTTPNTYAGLLTLNSGTLSLAGANGAINTTNIFFNGGKLLLDNSLVNNNNRLPVNAMSGIGNGSELYLLGNPGANTAEAMNTLAISNSTAIVTVSQANPSQTTVLAAGAFARSVSGTVLVRGDSLGQQAGQAQITLTNIGGLTLVGNTTLNAAPTSDTTTTLKVVPYMIGDITSTGNGSTLVTYDTTYGLRPMSVANEFTNLTLDAAYVTPAIHENALGGTVTLANSVTNNSLLFNGGGSLNGSSTALAVDSGLVAILGGSSATINNTVTNLILGNGSWNEGELFATVGNALNVNAPITVTGNGGLTKGGAGSVVCASSNVYSGRTSVNGGTLTLGTGDGNGNLPGTNVWIAPTATLTLNIPNATNYINGWVDGGGILKNNSTTGTLVLNQPAGAYLLKDFSGATGSTIVLGGTVNANTTIPSAGNNPGLGGNSPGLTLDFNGGNWLLTGDNNGLKFNWVIEGTANIVNIGRNFSFSQNNQTFAMHGGFLTLSNQYGMRLGQAASLTFTGIQDGGTIWSDIAGDEIQIGGNYAGTVATYTMSGGTIYVKNDAYQAMQIGTSTAPAGGISTFTMTNNAKFYSWKKIVGLNGVGAQQVFNLAGGTLAVAEIDASKLSGPAAPATQGTFYNNGGIFAPGDLGTPGKTIIDGNLTLNSGTLAIDIGGITQANSFTNAGNNYDFVSVVASGAYVGNATLGGQLAVNLINNFTPTNSNAYTILTAANSIIGGGTNIGYSGYVPVTSNNVPLAGKYFQAVVIGKSLILTNYGAALPTLVAKFSPTNTAGTPPLPVLFTDYSSGAITNHHWKFGDGTTLDTTSTSISHTFTNLGVYQVVLTVQALDGSSLNATGKVSVVNPGGTLTWTGAHSAFWDTSTYNWLDALSTPYQYADGDGVVFDDTATVTNVTLNLPAGPNAVNFNNSVNQYTVSGSGGIGGGSTLSVNNYGGVVTLLTANTYGGATTIASGATLQLGNGTTSGSIDGTASIDDEGLLIVDDPDNHTISNPVNGYGSLTKAGAGTFSMPNGTLYGNVIVNGGKFSTTDYTNIPSATTLAVSNGGIYEFTAGPTAWYHTIVLGAGGGGLNHSANVDIFNPLTATGPFIKGGLGTMSLNVANDYTGGTVINGGTMVVNDPATLGATGPLTMAPATTLNYNSSVSMTNSPVDATGAVINNNNASAVITLQQTAGAHGLGAVGGVSGATNVFAGAPAAVTTITGSAGVGLGVAGMTAQFTGGTWFNANSGQQPVNVEIDGGNLILPAGAINSQWLAANQTLTIHGGSLVSSNNYGLRLANLFTASGATGGNIFTGVQDGGLLMSASGDGLQWGSAICPGFSYTLSGGTIQILAGAGPLNLGGDLSGVGTTVFTLTGTGKLLAGGNYGSSSIQGANGSPAQQVFAFDGGTLAVGTYNATFLQPALGAPSGTLVNNGGTLAPGDIGTPGLTIITGNYAVSNSAAVLDIDLGGSAKANAFQSTNSYDSLTVNGNATLAGSLNLRELNGFEPIVGQNPSFTILTATNGITGAFANVASGSRLAVSGFPSRSFRVTVSSTNVVLDAYQTPTPQAYFTYNPASGSAPLTVTFTNLSNGAGLTNLWTFGDGATSTAASPTHTYATAPGTNTVSLTVGNTTGGNTYTVTNAVVVTVPVGPSGPVPLASAVVGTSLVLNWPNGQNWVLEVQTNSLSTGLVGATNAWTRLSGATSPFTNSINPASGAVFYRLVYP